MSQSKRAAKLAKLEALAASEGQGKSINVSPPQPFAKFAVRSPQQRTNAAPQGYTGQAGSRATEDVSRKPFAQSHSGSAATQIPKETPTPSCSVPQEPFATQVVPSSWELPVREYRVLHPAVPMRTEPQHRARVCGSRERGDIVQAIEETFAGWIRLVQKGWIYCGMVPGKDGPCMEPASEAPLLPAERPAWEDGPQEFEVTFYQGVDVSLEPLHSATTVGRKACGERVWAETQTYSGWLRLTNGEGWMHACTPAVGPTLRCLYLHQTLLAAQSHHDEEKNKKEMAAELALEKELDKAKRSQIWDRIGIADSSENPISVTSEPRHDFGRIDEVWLCEREMGVKSWNVLNLPVQEFLALKPNIVIRAGPGEGACLGAIPQHKKFGATLESFDGWLKLADKPGWICRFPDDTSQAGENEMCRALAASQLKAVPEVCRGGPRRRMFEVVAQPSLSLLREPSQDAEVTGFRWCGQFVLAEAQTFHGWVRVAELGGWMLSFSPKDGQLLRSVSALEHSDPVLPLPAMDEESKRVEQQKRKEEEELAIFKQLEEEDRKEALQELKVAAETRDRESFNVAIKVARQRGVAKKDIARIHALFTADL